MKITIVKSNIEAKISGTPAIVTFTVTQKNLDAFNRSQGGSIRNAPSYNEEVNKQRGLPCPEAMRWLRSVYSDKFGLMSGNLTMKDIQQALT